MPIFLYHRKFLALLSLTLLFTGCRSTSPNITQTAAPTTTPPFLRSEVQHSVITPHPTTSALSVKPPPAQLIVNGQTQIAGIGTYCWKEGVTGQCADASGISTPREPLTLSSPVTATLTLPLITLPSALQWEVHRVTDADAEVTDANAYRSWLVYPTDATQLLPLQREQTVQLRVDSGMYVIRVGTWWDGIGDVTYGFLINVH